MGGALLPGHFFGRPPGQGDPEFRVLQVGPDGLRFCRPGGRCRGVPGNGLSPLLQAEDPLRAAISLARRGARAIYLFHPEALAGARGGRSFPGVRSFGVPSFPGPEHNDPRQEDLRHGLSGGLARRNGRRDPAVADARPLLGFPGRRPQCLGRGAHPGGDLERRSGPASSAKRPGPGH